MTLKTTTPSATNNHRPAPKVALVLGGGGIKGVSHAGVLEVLESAGIRFDLIVGCSIGALIGALYADKKDAKQVRDIAFDIAPFSQTYKLFGLPSLYKGIVKGQGLFPMKRISSHLQKMLHAKTFEDLNIPLLTVATNLTKGRLETFGHGTLIPPLCASAAVPGVFQPIKIGTDHFVDGYVIEPLPTLTAQKQGARFIIAVNICNKAALPVSGKSGNIIRLSLEIMMNHRLTHSMKQADVLIDSNFVRQSYFFTTKKGTQELYQAGKKAAERVLPLIKKGIKALG